ncbi:hypothetical protein vBSflM004_071 [Shigella phage vB_SflM_004]|nr:hypothetical protein vBSflM004_071 [Shigella phage vB_SflM_004]
MKKILLASAMVMAMNLPVKAMKMPEANFNGVALESCKIVQKIASNAGELTKPLSAPTVQEMTDKMVDYNYHFMGDYYDRLADEMVTQNVDVLDSKGIEAVEDVKDNFMRESFKGVQYFIENRNCIGL